MMEELQSISLAAELENSPTWVDEGCANKPLSFSFSFPFPFPLAHRPPIYIAQTSPTIVTLFSHTLSPPLLSPSPR